MPERVASYITRRREDRNGWFFKAGQRKEGGLLGSFPLRFARFREVLSFGVPDSEGSSR